MGESGCTRERRATNNEDMRTLIVERYEWISPRGDSAPTACQQAPLSAETAPAGICLYVYMFICLYV